jgi:F-type H+-transporting ATPase subunit a
LQIFLQSAFFADVILAAADGSHKSLPMDAPVLFEIFGFPLTNSALISLLVAVAIVALMLPATRNPGDVPGPLQNFWEWVIESFQNLLAGIMGEKLARDTFWFFTTIFIFIFVANLLALFPGVGSVKIASASGELEPIARGANADVNMTLAMALVFFAMWLYWGFKYNGIGGFFHHIFGSKAGFKGIAGLALAFIFFLVGFIEVISILFRPVSLSFRLFGNIYGGEVLLESMLYMNKYWSWLIAMPFYFFELLVALVQSLVFCLLTAVFTAIMCRHDEEHAHH